MHSTHIETSRQSNTTILLDVYKLCIKFIIRKPRPQANAIDVTLNHGHQLSKLGVVIPTMLLWLTPEVGEVTMTTQAVSTCPCTTNLTCGTTKTGTLDKSIYLSKVNLLIEISYKLKFRIQRWF